RLYADKDSTETGDGGTAHRCGRSAWGDNGSCDFVLHSGIHGVRQYLFEPWWRRAVRHGRHQLARRRELPLSGLDVPSVLLRVLKVPKRGMEGARARGISPCPSDPGEIDGAD